MKIIFLSSKGVEQLPVVAFDIGNDTKLLRILPTLGNPALKPSIINL
jgi:hypothetical protein